MIGINEFGEKERKARKIVQELNGSLPKLLSNPSDYWIEFHFHKQGGALFISFGDFYLWDSVNTTGNYDENIPIREHVINGLKHIKITVNSVLEKLYQTNEKI